MKTCPSCGHALPAESEEGWRPIAEIWSRRTGAGRQTGGTLGDGVCVFFASATDRDAFYEALCALPAPPSQEQKP